MRIKNYGSKSYPGPELIKEQENTKFPKDITFSILVPLYNTPEKFLVEMIESVQDTGSLPGPGCHLSPPQSIPSAHS